MNKQERAGVVQLIVLVLVATLVLAALGGQKEVILGAVVMLGLIAAFATGGNHEPPTG
jgi:hypothetical protein